MKRRSLNAVRCDRRLSVQPRLERRAPATRPVPRSRREVGSGVSRSDWTLTVMLDSHGVAHLWLFGSFARDEAREDSDVDLLVEFSRPIGMFEFVRLQRELGERIGRKVELVTRAALKPQLRDRTLAEAVLAA